MDFNLELILSLATILSGVFYILRKFLKPDLGRLYIFIDFISSLFIIFLVVLIIRSFVFEPFRIPSGSMLPTLRVGDFILVNKFTYGLRLPVLRYKFFNNNEPQRGDVVVFKYPRNPSQNFIKRVIGVPGDYIKYYNKVVYINGIESTQTLLDDDYIHQIQHKTENLINIEHDIFIQTDRPTINAEWHVPSGYYMVMGDNRDNSNDSRAWGFVPEDYLVGHAFMIWMHWNIDKNTTDFSRIGNTID